MQTYTTVESSAGRTAESSSAGTGGSRPGASVINSDSPMYMELVAKLQKLIGSSRTGK